MKETALIKKMFIKGLLTKVIVMTLIIFLAIMLGSLTWVEAASELTASQRIAINFSDMDDSHWAARQIRDLQMKGVLMGFADGTFRPDDAIKKIEGLVMAVRILGLDHEAVNRVFDSFNPLNVYDALGLGWSKGYLEVAYEQGLIDRYSDEWDWYEDADRIWMARLFTKVLGKESLAQSNMGRELYYTDAEQIPSSMRGYAHVMFTESLMEGYPDRTFRPNEYMNRAEIASLFVKYLDKYVVDYSYKELNNVTIQEIDTLGYWMIVRHMDYSLEKYYMDINASVFKKEGNKYIPLTASQLLAGDVVNLSIYDDEVLLVDVVGTGYIIGKEWESSVPGYSPYINNYKNIGRIIYAGDISQNFIVFDNLFGGDSQFSLAEKATITNGYNLIDISDLVKNDLYIYEIRDGVIVKMDKVRSYNQTYRGTIVSYSDYTGSISIRILSGEVINLILPMHMNVEVRVNDVVEVKTYDDMVFQYSILSYSYIEGRFVSYNSDRKEIKIFDNQDNYLSFYVVSGVHVNTPAKVNAKLSDLKEGDYVQFKFKYINQEDRGYVRDEVDYITVLAQMNYHETNIDKIGVIYDIRDNLLIIDSVWGNKSVYLLPRRISIMLDGINMNVSDLKTGQEISYWYEGNMLRGIEMITGTKTMEVYLDSYDWGYVWLSDENKHKVCYKLSEELAKRYEKDKYISLGSMVDSYIYVVLTNNEITLIEKSYYSGDYQLRVKLWTYNQEHDLLWVKNNNKYYIYRMHPEFFTSEYNLTKMSRSRIADIVDRGQTVRVSVINGVVMSLSY